MMPRSVSLLSRGPRQVMMIGPIELEHNLAMTYCTSRQAAESYGLPLADLVDKWKGNSGLSVEWDGKDDSPALLRGDPQTLRQLNRGLGPFRGVKRLARHPPSLELKDSKFQFQVAQRTPGQVVAKELRYLARLLVRMLPALCDSEKP